MSEKPILFSGAMVRAILDGAKTQTRRLVKLEDFGPSDEPGFNYSFTGRNRWTHHHTPATLAEVAAPIRTGDTLWVKETWRTLSDLDGLSPSEMGQRAVEAGYAKPWAPVRYEADGAVNGEWRMWKDSLCLAPGKTRVSIHMQRWASRLALRVTDVRVERLGDISEADCIAEGACHAFRAAAAGSEPTWHPLRCFPWLWCQVRGPDAWERDGAKWVWVYGFEVAS